MAQATPWWRNHSPRSFERRVTRGATDGAPAAQHVIDRWHLLKNLREAIERFLSHTQLSETASEDARLATSPRQKRTSGERARSQGSREFRLALSQQIQERPHVSAPSEVQDEFGQCLGHERTHRIRQLLLLVNKAGLHRARAPREPEPVWERLQPGRFAKR